MKKYINYLPHLMVAISGFILIVLDMTEFRLGHFSKAEAINNILRSLSYGIISAYIFYMVVEYVPYRLRKGKVTPIIHISFIQLRECFRNCKSVVNTFCFTSKEPAKDDFINKFAQLNLYDTFFVDSKLAYLEKRRQHIIELIRFLLQSREYLSEEEFNLLCMVLKSPFFNQNIIPGNEERQDAGNQREIGEAIYDIYDELTKMHN